MIGQVLKLNEKFLKYKEYVPSYERVVLHHSIGMVNAEINVVMHSVLSEEGVMIVNNEEVQRRCRMDIYPDGRKSLLVDGRPALEMHPIVIREIEPGKFEISQKYRKL
jgi:hypothetical protein